MNYNKPMHVELDHKCKVASKPRRNGKEAKTQRICSWEGDNTLGVYVSSD